MTLDFLPIPRDPADMRVIIFKILLVFQLAAWGDTQVITDTRHFEGDGSRIALSMTLSHFSEMGQYISPQLATDSEQRFLLFVPAGLNQDEKSRFKTAVLNSLKVSSDLRVIIELIPVDIDLLQAAVQETAESVKQLDMDEASKRDTLTLLRNWSEQFQNWNTRFIEKVKRIHHWKQWPTEQKLMLIGSGIGLGKAALSVGFWIPSTGANIYGFSQAAMSLVLDFFFARWGHRVEAWKGRHRIGTPRFLKDSHIYQRAVNLYNDAPVLKAFVIDNLIAISAGAYFRALSYAADSTGRVQSPLSWDFAQNILGGMTIGGISGAAGGQGVRTLRRKGYIGPRTEYALFQLFGLGMQIGGFLNGAGMSTAFWVFLKAEAVFKFGLYFASRALPNRKPRTLVFHEGLSNASAKNIQYQHGLYDAIVVDSHTIESEISKHQVEGDFLSRIKKRLMFVRHFKKRWLRYRNKIRCRSSI